MLETMSSDNLDYGTLGSPLGSDDQEVVFSKKTISVVEIHESNVRFRFLAAFLFCGFLGLSFLTIVSLRNISVSYVQYLASTESTPKAQIQPEGSSIMYPTMYPTEQHPTFYPTIVTVTATFDTPTQYPTGEAPTIFPTKVPDGSPTQFPTEKAPTEFPSITSVVEASPFPSTAPTALSMFSAEETFSFTTKRDGYDYLSFFSADAVPYLKYKVLDGYSGVVEPEADMYLHVFETDTATSYDYKYTICSVESNTCEDFSSNEPFKFSCTPLKSNYTIKVEQYDNIGTSSTATGSLLCMYVRREFRTLTELDLNKTMNAMWTMWDTEEEEGIEKYGDEFHNYARLLEYHYFNAAWQDSDHIHEGNGFIAQHIKMDLIFQRSMQSVDPSITLPYWDFTIENATGIQVWDSPIFTPETFGSLPLPADMIQGWTYEYDTIETGGISDGRWKNFKAEYNTKYSDLYSAYGYMRAPWNMNPSNLITRFTSVDKYLPTCDSHYTLMSYTLLSDFLFQVPYAAHASVHGVVGGVYGCDLFNPLLEKGYIIDEQAKLNLCKNWIFYLKEFYRDALVVPKSDCTSVDETGEFSTKYEHQNCGYECVDSMVNILFQQLQRSVLNSDYECVDVDSMPQEGWLAWKEFICDGDGYKVFGGDHLESASPADPSFWPIHPTLERLLHARFMAGGFDTDGWPSDPINDYVCNKKVCYDPDQTENDDTRSMFSTWDSCCYGHYQDDQLMDAPGGNKSSGVGPTNREIFEWTNPTLDSYAMEYIYDGFTWDHCAETGYDMAGLLDTLYYNTSFSASNESAITVTSEKGWRKHLRW